MPIQELDFLLDSNLITSQQYETITAQLPHQPAIPTSQVAASPAPPSASLNNLSLSNTNGSINEKQNGYFSEKQNQTNGYQSPPGPPPAYNQPSALCLASALYAYDPTDAGDLALSPSDRIIVTEYMNAEWWKGQNERTNLEGIFPRSYVKVLDEKPPALTGTPQPLPSQQQQNTSGPMSYGNMPMAVAQGGSGGGGDPKVPTKTQEQGKKFGKKLGNAAIFGAGATIGGNIVNSIF